MRNKISRLLDSCAAGGAILTVLLFGAPLDAGATGINLFVNGSFEQPVIVNPATNNLWGLYRNIPGWTVQTFGGITPEQLGYAIELQSRGLYGPGDVAPDGNQWAEADLDNVVRLAQVFDTIVGATYELTFAYSPRPDVEWQDAAVFLNGEQFVPVGGRGANFITGVPTSPSFQYFTASFLGTGRDEISFGSLFTVNPGPNGTRITPAGGGNLFDDFRLIELNRPGGPGNGGGGGEPIPEPMTLSLLATGLAGLVYRRKVS